MKNSDKGNSMKCRATLDDVLVLPRVLLDSGSDESLVSNGLLQALERLGSRPSVVVKPTVTLKPYGENSLPLKVTRQVQFKALTLETSIGPLALRGLKVWVDEQSPQINLLIGRPVMDRLGLSVDGMLVDALKKRQTWEVGDLGDGEDKPRTVQRLRETYGDDAEELDSVEGVACSTLSMEKTTDPDGQIRRILDEKVAEAMERGLMDVQAVELRRILTQHIDVPAWSLVGTCRWMWSR
ncbi:hypothetical protein H310_14304 [Aphanomyces invadans]|uniref:Peptidase A2 domain-containing protein n=1 Tax=Aphanomyces invadans TaxID=157072 RepID=A0A024TA03_9STRA|nr:hypothetical protein H310_14304 [Aphanomyces invadans]ETV90960.1 hypothetical protein H310_14304 [Aphanomyces invadans]|eukprot:XP_008880349.1 hypothetical protein H310_14304 [Aphanomyces invadans]